MIFFSESPILQQKRVFESHENEEMETLIHDSQHVDENSKRHEVKMLTAFAKKNMACQGMKVCIISYKVYYWPSTEICHVI